METYIKLSIYHGIMSSETKRMLSVKIPVGIKYRLDRAALEDRTTLQNKLTEILDESLPEYKKE